MEQMKPVKHQTVETLKDEPVERHPSQADDMTPTATYPVLSPRKPVSPPNPRKPDSIPLRQPNPEPDPDTEPHVHIRGLQHLPRRQHAPGWQLRRLKIGVLLVTFILVLIWLTELIFIPATTQFVPSTCSAVGTLYTDSSGMKAQLALCQGRYIVVVQQADGVTAQQAIEVWTLHTLSPKKAVYEAQATLYFVDQTSVVVGLTRQGTSGTPHIVWEHVS